MQPIVLKESLVFFLVYRQGQVRQNQPVYTNFLAFLTKSFDSKLNHRVQVAHQDKRYFYGFADSGQLLK